MDSANLLACHEWMRDADPTSLSRCIRLRKKNPRLALQAGAGNYRVTVGCSGHGCVSRIHQLAGLAVVEVGRIAARIHGTIERFNPAVCF